MRAVPVQARARARYDAILAAAKVHYDEAGRDRFTVEEVAKIAGCSVATIYRYFEDRVNLLDTAEPQRDSAENVLEKIRKVVNGKMADEHKLQTIRSFLS